MAHTSTTIPSTDSEPSSAPLSSLSPSTASVNVANFIATKLQWLPNVPDTNYKIWKKGMLCLMESQGLMNYIDLTVSLPLRSSEDYDIWKKNDALVKGWILGSLSDQIASTVLEFDSAKDIWFSLQEKFGRAQITSPDSMFGRPHIISSDAPKKTVNESTPLYRAVLDRNWEEANGIFLADPTTMTSWIDGNEIWRPLHLAVRTRGNGTGFLENLLQKLADCDLEAYRDNSKSTALHTAASVGNLEAAELLVNKKPDLCYTQTHHSHFPIHVAALHRQRTVLEYLIQHTNDQQMLNPYTGKEGQELLTYLIEAEYLDIALKLADNYPYMLRIAARDVDSPLTLLNIKMNELYTRNFSFWERFVSWCIVPSEMNQISHPTSNTTDIESLTGDTTHRSSVVSPDFRYKCIDFLAPRVGKNMKEVQLAKQLLKCMCKEIASQDFNDAAQAFHEAILVAAELDAREVVVEITKTFPGAIYSIARPSGQHIFHKAIESRSVNVFNLIYRMSDYESFFATHYVDNYGNTPLHSAGKLAPTHKLNEVSGAALQMQREMQWFEEVEKLTHPYSKEQKNSAGKTPKVVFTEEHYLLKEAGEKWMRETATSYTLVAVLIATVMFTGAITVPGGNDVTTGLPVFSKEPAFIIFAISDAVSLLASITSVVFFLAILTSRYAEKDFFDALPKKLMFGIAAILVSIIFMSASFIATLYLVLGQKKQWVLFPLLISVCMFVAPVAPLHLPLVVELYFSTCGRGIFSKMSKP